MIKAGRGKGGGKEGEGGGGGCCSLVFSIFSFFHFLFLMARKRSFFGEIIGKCLESKRKSKSENTCYQERERVGGAILGRLVAGKIFFLVATFGELVGGVH